MLKHVKPRMISGGSPLFSGKNPGNWASFIIAQITREVGRHGELVNFEHEVFCVRKAGGAVNTLGGYKSSHTRGAANPNPFK